jgi:2-polyprenyl-6-methoxyphenol hydroxylase-like FAD-dependent oxidoreductase
MSKLRVLIVGASIAGPTAAYWFAKAGATVTVIERFPQFRRGGQNVDIRTAGVTVMRKMTGMEEAVRSKLWPLEGFNFVRSDGSSFGCIKATGNPDQQALISEYEIFRGNLAEIIYDLTRNNPNIEYIFNEQVETMQQSEKSDGPITVGFLNGNPSSQYDLVVAADGATSRTRAIGLQCNVRDHMVPLNGWLAFGSIKDDLFSGSKLGHAYAATPGRFIGGGLDRDGRSRVFAMSLHPPSDTTSLPAFRDALKHSDAALREHVASRFRDAGWKTNDIMAGLATTDDFYATEMAQVKVPSLFKGRFVMIGDAGCAAGPTGGGTTLAMAGGYLLAGEILRSEGDVAAGLRGFEEQMAPLIKELQKIPPIFPGVIAPQTGWGLWLRNSIIQVVCWSGLIDVAQRWLGGAFADVGEFPLREYDWVE